MLGKEVKIATIMKQRRFIEQQLKDAPKRSKDGDVSYRYVGHVYPENIEFFQNEGFFVYEPSNDLLSAMAHGLPVYIFIPDDEKIILTEEELKQAEEAITATGKDTDTAEIEDPLLRFILGLDDKED